MNVYQAQASRTIIRKYGRSGIEQHALHLLSAEVGELHGIFQKTYQGHMATEEHIKKELGDILWGIAEFCTANGWELEEIARINIAKLKVRYPGEGFDAERSVNRAKYEPPEY